MHSEDLQVGKRVKIAIRDPKDWTREAVNNMNGKLGTITKVERIYCALVEFDEPAKPFYANGSEHKSFWFASYDLVEE